MSSKLRWFWKDVPAVYFRGGQALHQALTCKMPRNDPTSPMLWKSPEMYLTSSQCDITQLVASERRSRASRPNLRTSVGRSDFPLDIQRESAFRKQPSFSCPKRRTTKKTSEQYCSRSFSTWWAFLSSFHFSPACWSTTSMPVGNPAFWVGPFLSWMV